MLRRWTFLPLRNAETGGGTGTATEAGATTANTETTAGTETTTTTTAATQATASVRPDWLPEDQWDATAGKPKFDLGELVKAKATLDERAGQVPADAAAYKVELPADLKLPEGLNFEVKEGDPLLTEFRAFAHANGLTQAQFSGVLALRAKMDAMAHEQATAAMQAEVKSLGDKAQERIDGATTFLRSKLPADQFDALKGAITSAKGVEAVETLMKLASGPQLPGNGGGPASEAVSTEDYYKKLFNSK